MARKFRRRTTLNTRSSGLVKKLRLGIKKKKKVVQSKHKLKQSRKRFKKKLIEEFKCDSEGCCYSTLRKGDLKTHVDTVHKKLKPFQCPSCSYAASGRSNLNKHIKSVHIGTKEFKCQQCQYATGKSFYTNILEVLSIMFMGIHRIFSMRKQR